MYESSFPKMNLRLHPITFQIPICRLHPLNLSVCQLTVLTLILLPITVLTVEQLDKAIGSPSSICRPVFSKHFCKSFIWSLEEEKDRNALYCWLIHEELHPGLPHGRQGLHQLGYPQLLLAGVSAESWTGNRAAGQEPLLMEEAGPSVHILDFFAWFAHLSDTDFLPQSKLLILSTRPSFMAYKVQIFH